MKTWQELRKELLKNPEIKAEFDRLEPEYQMARQLIKARLQKKMTQAEVAQKTGFKQEYIARLESGSANPTIESVSKVAKVLGKNLKLVGSR